MLRTLLHLSLALAARAVTWTNPLNTLNQPITGLTVTYDLSADGSGVDFTVTFTGSNWLAIGPSPNGQMVGSKAVLGTADSSSPPQLTAMKYNLGAKDFDQVAPEATQDLTGASFTMAGGTMLSDKATGNVLLQVDTYTPPRPAPAPTQGLRHRILS